MNQHQTIFALFFTLYSAMAIAITGKLQPFDTPSMIKWYPRAWLRFFFSIILLNFLPLACFVLVYNALAWVDIKNFPITIFTVLLLFLPGLVSLGFYRIHYGLMLLRSRTGHHFYDKSLYSRKTKYLPDSLYYDLESRPRTHRESLPHILPGIIWVLISLLPTLIFLKCGLE